MILKSDFGLQTLKERWDDKTSFKNFAGGDDFLDTVFISRRYGRIVCLKNKPRCSHNLFGSVFWGIMIPKKKGGTTLFGFLGISILDLIITACIYTLYAMIINAVIGRGDTDSAKTMIIIGSVALFFIFFTFPKTRRKFKEILQRVTLP